MLSLIKIKASTSTSKISVSDNFDSFSVSEYKPPLRKRKKNK